MSLDSKISAFKEVITELLSFKKEYEYKFSQLQGYAEKEVVENEYSKGGEKIPRGYYCPSPILEYVAGNCNRGRLLKRMPNSGKYTYEYGFDKDRRLIKIKRITEYVDQFYEEYLIYRENVVYSLEFNSSGDVIRVSKCTYEADNIVKYVRSVCIIESQADLNYEEYMYENGKLTEVTMFNNVLPSIGVYSESRYNIESDDKGRIVKLIGGNINNGSWDRRTYDFS